MEVLDPNASDAKDFLRKLIDCRLAFANWKGRCDTLIGQSTPVWQGLVHHAWTWRTGKRRL